MSRLVTRVIDSTGAVWSLASPGTAVVLACAFCSRRLRCGSSSSPPSSSPSSASASIAEIDPSCPRVTLAGLSCASFLARRRASNRRRRPFSTPLPKGRCKTSVAPTRNASSVMSLSELQEESTKTGSCTCDKARLSRTSAMKSRKGDRQAMQTSRSTNAGNPESKYAAASRPLLTRTRRRSAPMARSTSTLLSSPLPTKCNTKALAANGRSEPDTARRNMVPWCVRPALRPRSHGKRMVTVVPLPRSEATVTSPSWSLARCCATGRPMPMPRRLRESLPSSCWKGSKIFRSFSGGMPSPVSATSISRKPLGLPSRAEIRIEPAVV
mmetsp:Transcript_31740/g.91426  ORF Transcript_31740/g.91426 Transcript_31740/m.91426 type:complete len:326 (-) Transcript_31740:474-1451(-)